MVIRLPRKALLPPAARWYQTIRGGPAGAEQAGQEPADQADRRGGPGWAGDAFRPAGQSDERPSPTAIRNQPRMVRMSRGSLCSRTRPRWEYPPRCPGPGRRWGASGSPAVTASTTKSSAGRFTSSSSTTTSLISGKIRARLPTAIRPDAETEQHVDDLGDHEDRAGDGEFEREVEDGGGQGGSAAWQNGPGPGFG